MNKKIVHHCHAIGCGVTVPPRMLMCREHWNKVPGNLKNKVWEHYVEGQEISKNPTLEYLYWSCKARIAVAEKEGTLIPPSMLEFIHSHQEQMEGIFTPKTAGGFPWQQ